MRHVHPLGFDDLESRKLMTKVHAKAVPLVFEGTLAVDRKDASSTMDMYGDTYRTTPVSGMLVGVGKVKGAWQEEADYYGDLTGTDTIQLKGQKGSFTVTFDPSRLGKEHPVTGGQAFAAIPQKVRGGSGAYAGASEDGSIVVTTNAAKTAVESMTLGTGKP
jgi:hypothetical protein